MKNLLVFGVRISQGGADSNFILLTGARPEDGVPDMTVISEIDQFGINTNLKIRYKHDRIYVSTCEMYMYCNMRTTHFADLLRNNTGCSQSIQTIKNL